MATTHGPAGTLDQVEADTNTDDSVAEGDHDRFAHYVKKDKIMRSALSGNPVVALCGKIWVPGRDPEKFPVCPSCKKIYEQMKND
tara:strand:- start:374 stop:628 length:255 start_codon:yes stop_codon:yes gene_type:complete